MTILIFIGVAGLLLIGFGVLIGAELQDRVHEQHRRRMVARARDLERRAADTRHVRLFVDSWDDGL